MVPIIALALTAAGVVPDDSCAQARVQYEALSLEEAVLTADRGLATSDRPLDCLEVRALALTVLGRLEEAREAWAELFERSPDREIVDPSLAPSVRASIEAIREEVRPLVASVSARWLFHESLRLDVILEGGLRGATRVSYDTVVLPADEVTRGEVALVGKVATATVSVPVGATAHRLRFNGRVSSPSGRTLHQFTSEILLPERPAAQEAEKVIVEVEKGGVHWLVWTGLGVGAAAAAAVIIVLAQPDLPNARATLGRVDLRP